MSFSKKLLKGFLTLGCFLAISTSVFADINPNEGRGFKILLDPAKDINNPGSYTPSGETEYILNYKFAEELKQKLEKFGFEVKLTRTQNSAMDAAKRVADSDNYNLFIVLQHDTVNEKYCTKNAKGYCKTDHARGYSIFINKANAQYDASEEFAEILGRNLMLDGMFFSSHHSEKIAGENKESLDDSIGLYVDDIEILKLSKAPSILLNLAVISNPSDMKSISERKIRNKYMQDIIDSIRKYKDGLE